MNESTKELIAIGASLTAHYQPCMAFHINKARKLGIRDNEIDEAIAVGHMIQMGAMSVIDKFAENVICGSERRSSKCCSSNVTNCCR